MNALQRMVAAHLSRPHDFVCLTDRSSGEGRAFGGDVRAVRALDTEWPKRYPKLQVFSPAMRQIVGPRFLYVDLDVVVVGAMDPLVDRNEPFVVWRDPNQRHAYNTSLILMDAGARSVVWSGFDVSTSPARCRHLVGSDQAWVTHALPNEPTWSEKDGVYSYRRHARDGAPRDARLVFFHGRPKPWDVGGPWADLWRSGAA